MSLQKDIKKPSILSLIGSNILLLILALIFKWQLYDVLLAFWLEAVIIGVINFLKMIKVPYQDKFKKGVLKELPNTEETGDVGKLGFIIIKILLIQAFVIIHLGFSVVAGFAINRIFNYSQQGDFTSIFDFTLENKWSFIIAIIGIALSHIASYVTNYIRGEEYKTVKVKQLLFTPLRRLFLVWVVILTGGYLMLMFGTASMLLLIPYFVAKIFIDIRQHIKEHKRLNSVLSDNT